MKKLILMMGLLITVNASAGQDGGGNVGPSKMFELAANVGLEILSLGDNSLSNVQGLVDDVRAVGLMSTCGGVSTEADDCGDTRYIESDRVLLFVSHIWNEKTCAEKTSVATHEFLKIAGVETDTNKKYSDRFKNNTVNQCLGESCAEKEAQIKKKMENLCLWLDQIEG